jgi:HSF-type DNA-binding
MLVMLHMDKVLEDQPAVSPPPIDWCTRETGDESDHVIVINDCARLVNEILPQFGFPTISTESFVRKMYRWGFRQVSSIYSGTYPNSHTPYMYKSEHFRKGNLALLSKMESRTATKTSSFCTDRAKGAVKRNVLAVASNESPAKRSKVLIDSDLKKPESDHPLTPSVQLALHSDGNFSPNGSHIEQTRQQHSALKTINTLLALKRSVLISKVVAPRSSLNWYGRPFPATAATIPCAYNVPASTMAFPVGFTCGPTASTALLGTISLAQHQPMRCRFPISRFSLFNGCAMSSQEITAQARPLVTNSHSQHQICAQKMIRPQNRGDPLGVPRSFRADKTQRF